jgi:N-acetylmuramoyl-L-alanine amidase
VRKLTVLLVVFAVTGAACGDASALAKVQVPGVQVALYRHGHYKGPIDGIAGPLTKQGIRNFQRSAGLKPDGIPGKRTRAAFGRFGGPLFGTRMLKRGMVGFDVSVLQFRLARRGFAHRFLTSSFDPVTERLVRGFQRRVGLPADGIVGRRTRAALLSQRGPRRPVASGGTRRHVVRKGETLTGIAARAGTTVPELARRNRLDPHGLLLVGTSLFFPQARASESQSRASVKASLGRWAAHYRIDVRLVRALAWQESGFQNDIRSRAGALGVMQVIPATWFFVERFVIGGSVSRTVDGNVRVGVAYLHHLLHQFRGDVRLALAAYHQGPASVRRRGVSGPTRRFVANVLALRGRV